MTALTYRRIAKPAKDFALSIDDNPAVGSINIVIRWRRNVQIQEFILDYIANNYSADVTDQKFHEEFTKKFGGKVITKTFGAEPNSTAMRWLKRLHDQGYLNRSVVSLIEHEQGFPNWVYGYTLNKLIKSNHERLTLGE